MSLKKYLKVHLEDENTRLKDLIDTNEGALGSLEGTDFGNACYSVWIHSFWSDYGEKGVKLMHTGTLQEAIHEAESEFKRVNRRNDVQGIYRAVLNLTECEVLIPQEYWEKFRS